MNSVFHPDGHVQNKWVLSIVLVFVVCFLPFALLGLIPEVGTRFVLWYLAANALWVIVAIALVRPYARTISYELGEHEVVVRRGLITRAVDSVPYAMITNIGVRRGPLDRLYGLGSLVVHTAGFSQQNAGPEAKLVGLRDYDQRLAEILATVRAHHAARVAPGTSAPAGEDERTATAQILAELRGIRKDLQALGR